MDLRQFSTEIRTICREFDVAMLAVFGSVARGQETPESDVDLLVRFKHPVGLIELLQMEDRFSDVFGRKVDLGTEDSLHPLIRDNVMGDLKILYEV